MTTSYQDSHTTALVTGKLYNAIRPPDRPLTSISTQSSYLSSLAVVRSYTGQAWDGPLTYQQYGLHELS